MTNVYEVLHLEGTEVAPTRVKMPNEKVLQRQYQEKIAVAVQKNKDGLLAVRVAGGISQPSFDAVFGSRVSQLTILLLAGCYTRQEVVDVMGIDIKAICNYLTQCTDRGVFYVQRPDGLLTIGSPEEWEQHRRAASGTVDIRETRRKTIEKLGKLQTKLETSQERLEAVSTRLVIAPEDEELQLQSKRLRGSIDVIEVDIAYCHQTLAALPPEEHYGSEETVDPEGPEEGM